MSGSARQCRTRSNRTGGGAIRVGQCRTALGKSWHGQDSAEPDRGGKGSVRQYRGMQDRVDTGWVVHSRIGRIGWGRAGSCKAGEDQTVSGKTGQDSARQVRSGQCQPEQDRAGQGREVPTTGQDREGPRRVAQCRTGLSKTW